MELPPARSVACETRSLLSRRVGATAALLAAKRAATAFAEVDAEVDGEKAVEASQLSVGGAPVTAPSARGT